jgi:hypothetical protein
MFEILFSAAEPVRSEQSRGPKAGKVGRCKLTLHQSPEGSSDMLVKFLYKAMANCCLKTVHAMKSVYNVTSVNLEISCPSNWAIYQGSSICSQTPRVAVKAAFSISQLRPWKAHGCVLLKGCPCQNWQLDLVIERERNMDLSNS